MKGIKKAVIVAAVVIVLVSQVSNGNVARAYGAVKDWFENPKGLIGAIADATKAEDKISVTIVEVKNELVPIGELATYSFEYEGFENINCKKVLLNHDLPGTKYTIKLGYSGCVKVGYDFTAIDVDVDNDKQIIKVSLPKQIVIANGIDNSKLKIDDSEVGLINNILNPVESDLVTNRVAELEQQKYDEAVNKYNINEAAEDNAKTIITEARSAFTDLGYEIIFVG